MKGPCGLSDELRRRGTPVAAPVRSDQVRPTVTGQLCHRCPVQCSVSHSVPSPSPSPSPSPPHPIHSRLIPSHPIPSHPIPSHPIPSHPISSHPIPSRPVPSRPVPSRPVPSRPVPPRRTRQGAATSPPPPPGCATALARRLKVVLKAPQSIYVSLIGARRSEGCYSQSDHGRLVWLVVKSKAAAMFEHCTSIPTGVGLVNIRNWDSCAMCRKNAVTC